MGAPDLPASPFSANSWEPRFVVEHYREEALQAAITLWTQCMVRREVSDGLVRYATLGPDHLLIEHPAAWHPGSLQVLPEPIPLSQLAAWIRSRWLSSATYPEEPWFEGGEARGYCVLWGTTPSSALVVIPKWFEIHK